MARKNKGKRKGKFNSNKIKRTLENGILTLLEDNPKKSFNYKQLSAAFEVKDPPTRQLIITILAELAIKKSIKEVGGGKFSIAQTSKGIEGRIEITRRGSGYVVNDTMDDIYIPPNKTKNALNRDTVEVRLTRKGRGSKIEGAVVRVVERAKKQYVGTLQQSKNFGFVKPDDRFLHVDFYIPEKHFLGAKDGDKVVVKMTQWPSDADNPTGEITGVLGRPGEHNTEMHAILAAYDLPATFKPEVEAAADAIPEKISDEEIARRKDMRDILTFTIDPVDAKDFDDALSYQVLKNGNYEIGVHIADVSHYVRPGDIVDKEAYTRATSVYLVDRVVPMLPEKLSNGICSLRPNEDKLTYSVIFEMNKDAKVVNYEIKKTVIHSDRRFAYEDAQERIETKEGDLQEEINIMDGLAKTLRKKRMSTGALELGSEEVRFQLDERGVPVGISKKVQKDANKLIEEFMLLANKYVAMEIGKPEKGKTIKPFVYRIHDTPNPDKLTRLVHFLNHIGMGVSNINPQNATAKLNELFSNMEDEKEISMIKTMAIRTMSKAEYATDNIGHYGLAFDYYSHFTSPIRRYPDLIVHRLLFEYLQGKVKYGIDLDDACKHTSMRERVAAEAERESIKYKQVEYLSERVGLAFEGIISGMNDTGFFVELSESRCEGMVRYDSISHDNYYFDEKAFVIRGKRSGREFFLGDPVDVLITKTDLFRKQVDMELVEEVY